jgi:hypothetical protein
MARLDLIAAHSILLLVNSEDARNPAISAADRQLIARTAQINRRVLAREGVH